MSAPAGTEAATKRFISGVVEGEQTAPGLGNFNPELRCILGINMIVVDLVGTAMHISMWCVCNLGLCPDQGFYGRPWTMEQRRELFKR